MTDYNAIMKRIGISDWVEKEGVKEIWIWGYHGGKVGLWESNMSGPYGDISNSNRNPNDLPTMSKTYTVYHYNYQRETSEAVEDHMHQIEAIFNHIDRKWFWEKFVGGGNSGGKVVNPGCVGRIFLRTLIQIMIGQTKNMFPQILRIGSQTEQVKSKV